MLPIGQKDRHPSPSELVLNADGSVYHLALKPEDIAERIILVGDPGRVRMVSSFFERIELERSNREFLTHTGTYNGQRLSVLSSGIGTDNIDIVLNELDALVNFDLQAARPLQENRSLELLRIGTSGAMHEDIPVGSFLLSEMAMGMDGVMHAYAHRRSETEEKARNAFLEWVDWPVSFAEPYFVEAAPELVKSLDEGTVRGITVTAHGFYGLQGRSLRLPLARPDLNEGMRGFQFEGLRISNFEMESSALFGLASSLGHKACTVCNIIANRYDGSFDPEHERTMKNLIKKVLNDLTKDR